MTKRPHCSAGIAPRTLASSGVWFGLLTLLVLALVAQAQAATYANRATPYSWVNPAAHARATWTSGAACSSRYVGAAIDDDITAQIPLGFTFNYGGLDYTQVQIMSNGRLQFNNGFCGYGTQTVGPPPTYPYPYPNASLVRTMRVYGTDLDPTPSGAGGACPTATCYVSYTSEGTAPNRRFIVTWVNVPEWGRTARTGFFNLQMILEEATQEFVYQFDASDHPTGGSAQIGWELSTTDFDVWSTPVVPPPNSAVRFFIPAPVAELRMDEAAWSAPGTVLNATSGGINASPVGAAQTVPGGRLCRGGNIPSNTSAAVIDAINTNYDVDTQIGSSGTITFWYKSNGAWSGTSSKSVQLLDASVTSNAWFFLSRVAGTGALRFQVSDDAGTTVQATTGGRSFAANTWVHIAVSWKLAPVASGNRLQVFINGAIAATTNIASNRPLAPAIGSLFAGDNRSAFITNPGTGNSADGVLDELRIYNSEVTNAVILRDYNANRVCSPVSIPPAGFNAFETSTPAGSVNGVIKTKIAASPFGLDIVALKSGGSAVETGFTGDVRVELVDSASGASCGAYPVIASLGVLNFATADQGRKTRPVISETRVWRDARLRMSYPATGAPSIVGCSSDNFAIRPANFVGLQAQDADWATAGIGRTLNNTGASGGVVHKAGQPFTLRAIAQNASGAAASNYAGAPSAIPVACTLPTTACTLGTLSAGSWTATGGSVETQIARYSEVGVFSMRLEDTSFADVDINDSTLVERIIASGAVQVGRFVPDHFVLTPANIPEFKTFNTTACAGRSFTYVGQPFGYVTAPQAKIVAMDATGSVTTNYSGALWKLQAADAKQVYSDVATVPLIDTGLVLSAVVSEAGGGVGSLSANPADRIAYIRGAPILKFNAAIKLEMRIQDSSENAVLGLGNGTIDTLTPATFPTIGFDSGDLFRYGRLVMTNAHGTELRDLPVTIETQSWEAAGFTRNAADNCTTLAANAVATGNWQRNLNACETQVTLGGPFVAGRGRLTLSRPGVDNTGSVDLTVQLGVPASGSTCVGAAPTPAVTANQSWLQTGSGVTYTKNPLARASFGLYRGSKSLIYMREMY